MREFNRNQIRGHLDTTVIKDKQFQYKYTLTEVIIPSGVTSIGIRAFESCGNLNKLIIPNSAHCADGNLTKKQS